MNDTFTKQLLALKEVVSVEKVKLTKQITDLLGIELSAKARNNQRKINAYRFTYKVDGLGINGFAITPKTLKGVMPCIVYNRGGSADFGVIKTGWLFTGIAAELAKAGYIVLATQYRGGGGSEGVDEMGGADVKDMMALRRFVKHLPSIDEKRVGMYGGSRGGMMTYLAISKKSPWVHAAVTVSGLANMIENQKYRPQMRQHYKKFFGGSREEMIKRSAALWPERFSKNVPILLMFGTSDWRVSPLESIQLFEGLYKNKVPVRLVGYEGADHSISEYKSEVIQNAIKWFDRFVRDRESLPDMKPHGK